LFTKELEWERWNGYRRDLVDAAQLAGDVVQSWTGYGPKYSVAIRYGTGLTEHADSLDAAANLRGDDLRDVRVISIEIDPDRDAWFAAAQEARQKGEDEPPAPGLGKVTIRAGRGRGVSVDMLGEDRTSVEGLSQRLDAVLGRAAPRLQIDIGMLALFGALFLVIPAIFLGQAVAIWLGGKETKGFDAPEFGIIMAPVVLILLAIGMWRAFPTFEVLDDGELPRARRLRKLVGAAAATIVLGVPSAFLYDLLTG
jgi:hypothetical protein